MKRKRNADDALRAAERRADTEGTPEAIKNYWRVALRAGQLPKPTEKEERQFGQRRISWSYNINNQEAQTWGANDCPAERLPRVLLVSSLDGFRNAYAPAATSRIYLQVEGRDQAIVFDFTESTEALEKVKELLSELIQETNPRRINADDALRAAERKAFATEDAADIAKYWQAALRAGQLPKPTVILYPKSKFNRSRVYTLYPRQYCQDLDNCVHWSKNVPRVIEWVQDRWTLIKLPINGEVDLKEGLRILLDGR